MKNIFAGHSFFVAFLLLALFKVGCATNKPQTDLERVFRRIPDSEYKRLIETYTQNDKRYEGFHNTYEVSVTMINNAVREGLLQREGYYMQWDSNKAQSEREKSLQKMSTGSEFFLSLFTPKVEHNDLHKEASMWKIFLEVNGTRYKGEVKKFNKNLVQTQNLFPHHARFNRGYLVEFNLPMTSLENSKPVFILTSSLGHTTFQF